MCPRHRGKCVHCDSHRCRCDADSTNRRRIMSAKKKTATATKKATKKATAERTPDATTTEATPKAKGNTKAARRPAKSGPSMLEAAAAVLAEAKEPMDCKALIETMAAKGLWTSPKGKTPSATLSAAMHREIKGKGKESRFRKADCGQFTLAPTK